jgi:hypothetical protein
MGKAINISRRIEFWFVLAFSSLLVVNASGGQEPIERPRIGLCLAGGGARGGAHIGVLKLLELDLRAGRRQFLVNRRRMGFGQIIKRKE